MARTGFRQSDLSKALRGLAAAGREPSEITIEGEKIRIVLNRSASTANDDTPSDVDAELDAWEASHGSPRG